MLVGIEVLPKCRDHNLEALSQRACAAYRLISCALKQSQSWHGKLCNGSAVFPAPAVNVRAFLILREALFCRPRISIYLPAANALEIPGSILNESPHILRRIAEKQSDFMWEFPASVQPSYQLRETFYGFCVLIPGSQQNTDRIHVGQIPFQLIRAEQVDQCASIHIPQWHCA